jgi:phosphoribosylformylglycinamidine cyclo-ligase
VKKKITYKKAGVDVNLGDALVQSIKKMTSNLNKKGMIGGIGGFGGAFALGKYKNPVLVSGTDGVGTKLKIAFTLNKHDTVGIDLVAMCVNDIITCGAIPLFFLDYFATGKLSLKQGEQIIKGIVEGCRQSNCALLGGETAEMPSFYKEGEYDLAGFAVGICEKEDLITGKNIKPKDIVIGIPSSGIHSNGYSLVRKAFTEKELKKYGNILLTPTRIYVNDLLPIIKNKLAKGFAHITGEGLPGNVPRSVPENCDIIINKKSWDIPEIFSIIQKHGNVEEKEMYDVFNMGIGMVLIVDEKNIGKVLNKINDSVIIGEIVKGKGMVKLV